MAAALCHLGYTSSFNSLFEMQVEACVRTCTEISKTFNSLFEMHPREPTNEDVLKLATFNSLFEMPGIPRRLRLRKRVRSFQFSI